MMRTLPGQSSGFAVAPAGGTGGEDTTTESMRERERMVLEGLQHAELRRPGRGKRGRKRAQHSRELQLLKEQLKDDKNFIFNS